MKTFLLSLVNFFKKVIHRSWRTGTKRSTLVKRKMMVSDDKKTSSVKTTETIINFGGSNQVCGLDEDDSHE